MHNPMTVIKKRLLAEWQDSEVTLPKWLAGIVMDEVYYIVLLITVCANSFGMGLVASLLVYI
jgi:hypothetical protein